jgi:hypothetical protein
MLDGLMAYIYTPKFKVQPVKEVLALDKGFSNFPHSPLLIDTRDARF